MAVQPCMLFYSSSDFVTRCVVPNTTCCGAISVNHRVGNVQVLGQKGLWGRFSILSFNLPQQHIMVLKTFLHSQGFRSAGSHRAQAVSSTSAKGQEQNDVEGLISIYQYIYKLLNVEF